MAGDSYYQPLSWAVRIKVALGAAKGPAFLHNLQRQVIHHDFMASNILLDSIYNAKLSDFGLAKDVPNWYDDMHVWTSIRGSYGYAAPEYVATGHLTVKSDVYGFGVVLLELLSGLRAVDTNQPAGQHNLVEWAKPNLGDKYKIYHVIDHQLEGQFPPKEAYEAAMLALQCLNTQARHRPHMKEIVERLEWLQAIKDGARIQSIANGSGNVSPRNMNYPSPGRPKQAGSPLPSYQCSPRQQ